MGASLPVVVTKPSSFPPSHWRCESFHVWFRWNDRFSGRLEW